MRTGRSFIVRDRGVDHNFVMQPVRPRGYVFLRNEKLMYCGIIFNEKRADERIEWLSRSIRLKAKLNGNEAFGWLETTKFTPPILAIDPPKDAMKTTQDTLDNNNIETPHVFNPVVVGGFSCMSCQHREYHQIHLRKESTIVCPPQLPMHYQGPQDRQAIEEDQLDVIVEHSNTEEVVTTATAVEGEPNGNL